VWSINLSRKKGGEEGKGGPIRTSNGEDADHESGKLFRGGEKKTKVRLVDDDERREDGRRSPPTEEGGRSITEGVVTGKKGKCSHPQVKREKDLKGGKGEKRVRPPCEGGCHRDEWNETPEIMFEFVGRKRYWEGKSQQQKETERDEREKKKKNGSIFREGRKTQQ